MVPFLRISRPNFYIHFSWLPCQLRAPPASYFLTLSHINCGGRKKIWRAFSVASFLVFLYVSCLVGTAVAQWLRCCATNPKVAVSIPDGVFGIFHWHNPSNRTMALGSTHPLTEMSTGSVSWGKRGWCLRLTTLPPFWAIVTSCGKLNFLEPSGHLGPVMGLIYLF